MCRFDIRALGIVRRSLLSLLPPPPSPSISKQESAKNKEEKERGIESASAEDCRHTDNNGTSREQNALSLFGLQQQQTASYKKGRQIRQSRAVDVWVENREQDSSHAPEPAAAATATATATPATRTLAPEKKMKEAELTYPKGCKNFCRSWSADSTKCKLWVVVNFFCCWWWLKV